MRRCSVAHKVEETSLDPSSTSPATYAMGKSQSLSTCTFLQLFKLWHEARASCNHPYAASPPLSAAPNRRAALQNELAILEFIHCFVEVLDKHFGQVCELDIMNEPDMVSGPTHGPMTLCCMLHAPCLASTCQVAPGRSARLLNPYRVTSDTPHARVPT